MAATAPIPANTPAVQTFGVYNPTAASSQPDPALLSSTTASILGLKATATQDTTNAQAETVAAQGDTAEAGAYTTAANIAGQQGTVAGISGQVQEYQQQLALKQAIGSQQAAIGASGATASGTALDLMSSSLQQGALAGQVIGLQTSLTEMGYTSAEAAANAEATAATSAASEANVLGTAYTTAANTATANETAATTDLTNYLNTYAPGGINSPGGGLPTQGNTTVTNDQQLLTDLTSGNTAAVQTDINTIVNPTTPGISNPNFNQNYGNVPYAPSPINPFQSTRIIGFGNVTTGA